MLAFRAHTLLFRLSALISLTLCLLLVSRHDGSWFFYSSAETSAALPQFQEPTITAEIQANAPLTITSVTSSGQMAPGSQFVEFGFFVINVSAKAIRAYAIKHENSIDGKNAGGGVTLYNPQLANSLLQPNQSVFIGDTSNISPEKRTIISLSVDFVEFSDGTKWGADSVRSSEKVAGQRAAATLVSQRLLRLLSQSAEDVVSEIESGMPGMETPNDKSEEWKEGFRIGRLAVVNRLKRAKEQRGLAELRREVQRFGETFRDRE